MSGMLQVEVEAWAYRLIRDAETRRRVEDSRAELKSNWPEARDVARQLAGHANAAAGEPILWLFGVDEHSGVVPYQTRNMADWRPQLDAEFEGVAPGMQHFALQWKDRPFEALVFRTDAPPYVVRNPKRGTREAGPFELDVPWREGATRSARRAELLLMLRPIGRAPTFTALGVRVQLLTDGQILLGAHVYAESPELQRILIRAAGATVDFGEALSELREVQQYGDGQDPDVVRTRSHLTVQGAGKIVLQGSGIAQPLPGVKEHVVLTIRFVIAAIPQPVSYAVTVPRAPDDGSTTGQIAIWKFGLQ